MSQLYNHTQQWEEGGQGWIHGSDCATCVPSQSPACQAGVSRTGLLMIKPMVLGLGGNTGTKYPSPIPRALKKVIVILQLWGLLKEQELNP